MTAKDILQQAVGLARAGHKIEARDLLLQVVQDDPQCEVAWIWLSGLVETLEDKIIACENVLVINPSNDKVHAYLLHLKQQESLRVEKENSGQASQLLKRAMAFLEQGDKESALYFAVQAVEKDKSLEEAWLLMGQVSPDLNEQVRAFEHALRLNPRRSETSVALDNARAFRDDPVSFAVQLERSGKIDEALEKYRELAAKAKDLQKFDHIYLQIARLEKLKKENVQFVAPTSSIWRLTFTWPLLYFFLVLVQVGLNPFAHPSIFLWLGLPWVFVGSLLLSVSEIRSRHAIWRKVFSQRGEGSNTARMITATAGWLLVILPHIILLLDSINRLKLFVIPPEPF